MACLCMACHGISLLCVRPPSLFHPAERQATRCDSIRDGFIHSKVFPFPTVEGYMAGFTETTWRSMRSEKYLMEVGPLITEGDRLLEVSILRRQESLRLMIRRNARSAVWWRARELNPRPLRCERSALPTELAPHLMEPATRARDPAGYVAHQRAD